MSAGIATCPLGCQVIPTGELPLCPLSHQLRDPQPSLRHLQDLALFRGGPLQALNHQPAAFVILDVSADLACNLGVPKEIKVVILVGVRARGAETERRGSEAGQEESLEPILCQCLLPFYLNLKELSHLQQDLLGVGIFLLPINARLQ